MSKGAFTFVLHSHLPYARQAGRWPHGEEWLHEGAVDTYLPLLAALHDLVEEGVRFRLTISMTPILVEQLADPLVLAHLETFLEELQERAGADIRRFEASGEPARAGIAGFYRGRFEWLLRTLRERFGRDIIGAFRRLQELGVAEIATSAATHGYLPLFERDSSIYGQVATGVAAYSRHFGRWPESFWLPECAYRPPYITDEGRGHLRPGLHEFLADQGILCFFSETHAIEGGRPVGKALGDALGPYGDIPRRYTVPAGPYPEPTIKTTYLPYWVGGTRIAVLGRNNRTGLQVWSAEHGYPGDYNYREFHKRDGVSGLHYWKVTGARVDLGDKALYDPDAAFRRVHDHAAHFSGLVEDLLGEFHARSGRAGVISAAYDTELFGHWWYEGVEWVKEVLRSLARSEQVQLVSAAEFVREHPPEDVLALPESSWGQAGNHFTWLNVDTEWMWPLVTEASLRMERLAAENPSATGSRARALQQAARELLLLQSSDWPFLITTGQAREYAEARFQGHLGRFHELAGQVEAGVVDDEAVCRYEDMDNPFPDINYGDFAERQGMAAPRERRIP